MSSGLIERAQANLRDPLQRQVLVGEVLRFAVVGAAGFVLDIGLFNVFIHLGIGPLSSKAMSTTVAALGSYALNRRWSFAHRPGGHFRRDLLVFLLLSAVGLGIAESCLAISHYGLGHRSRLADNVSGVGIGTVLGTIWRYFSFKRWVFTAPGTSGEEVLAASIV